MANQGHPQSFVTQLDGIHRDHSVANALVEISITDFFNLIRRRFVLILSVLAFCISLAFIFFAVQKPLYTASAQVQIDTRKSNIVNIQEVLSSISSDEKAIKSELDIVQSQAIAQNVVKTLGLTTDSEFSAQEKPGFFDVVMGSVKKIVSTTPANTIDQNANDAAVDPKVKASAAAVREGLEIERDETSYTIKIGFTSENPEKAKLIANTYVNQYIEYNLNQRFETTKQANSWLNQRLDELKARVQQSEQNVQKFKEEHNLIEADGRTFTEQQLSSLNAQLIEIRAERAQAEARLKTAYESASTSPDVLSSAVVQNLMAQETQVLRKRSDLQSRYGPKHPKMINVENELKDLKAKIDSEITKVVASLENQMNVIKSREQNLDKSLSEVQGENKLTGRANIELSELKRQLEADKTLYESFLKRFKETSEEQDMQRSDIKIVSWAETPSTPSFPKKSITLCIAVIMGLGIGIMLAILIESMDNTFRGFIQLEEATGAPVIGMIPQVEFSGSYPKSIPPQTIFFESLRTIHVSLQFSNKNKKPQVIMSTSSTPGEGKTFFTVALATILAQSGSKVLLIDGDMKRNSLTEFMLGDSHPEATLMDYIQGNKTMEQVIMPLHIPTLMIIPSSMNTAYSQEYLSSDRMRDLIERLRKQFDYIIFDSPPVLAVSDALITGKVCDASLFIVRWGVTPKKMVKNAIRLIRYADIPFNGCILTQVNLDKQKHYDHGDTAHYYGVYDAYDKKAKKV